MSRILATTALAACLALPAMAATVPDGTTLAENQTYTHWLLDSIKTLDPQKNTDSEGSDLLRQLFEGLYSDDPEGKYTPGVALSHELSDDRLTYTFALRDNAKWSNGEPVTASDFVYAWRRLADPETASQYAWFIELMNVEGASEIVAGEANPETLGVEAVDDHTLRVTLSQPTPYFPGMLTHASTFPVPQATVEEHGAAWTEPGNMVSNGAYTLVDHTLGVELKIARNDSYWNNDETVLDSARYLVVNDMNVALTRYNAGELDYVSIPAGQYPRLEKESPEEATSVPYACTYGYMFNVSEKGPESLKDIRVRKALALGINRDIIVDQILQGGQAPAYTWVHWAIAGYEVPEVEAANMTQEERTEKARALLEEAGYGADNPLKLSIQYNTSDDHKKIAIAVQQFWKGIGVQADLANYEWKVHTDRMQNQDFDVARYAWCGDYNEPSTYLDYFRSTGMNNGKWVNHDYDAKLDEALASDNPLPLYKEAEQILMEGLPIAPIYQYAKVFMLNDDVKGWPLENVMGNWYLKDFYRVAD